MQNYRLARRPGSPRWYIAWTENGRSRRYSTGTPDRHEAELALAAFRIERSKPPRLDPGEVELSAVLDSYIEDHAGKLPSAEQARIAVNHLKAHFGPGPVAAVTLVGVESYIARRSKTVSAATVSRELSVLRAALNRAAKRGVLARAPFVASLPAPPPRERFLTRREAARLLRACDYPHLRLFVRVGLYTGARPAAILDLTWERVDLESRLIHFPLPGRAHGAKRRAVVPVRGALYTALQRAKAKARSGHVIDFAGNPVASVRRSFGEAAERAGLKGVTPGTLRHTAATWAAAAGVDLHAIGGLLGHSKPGTTMRYAKYHPEYLKDAAWAALRGKRG